MRFGAVGCLKTPKIGFYLLRNDKGNLLKLSFVHLLNCLEIKSNRANFLLS